MTTRMRAILLAGCAGAALAIAMPAAAAAEGPTKTYAIGSMDLDTALREFAMTSGHDVVFDPALVRGRKTAGVAGEVSDEAALRTLLQGTELAFQQTRSGGFVVRAPRFQGAADPQSGSAAGGGAEVDALIVTAQKREENIQDVPIAISAFSAEALEAQKIEGGFDLLKAIPNVTFSKNNFTSYNFSIRGVGTKAVSATTDPGVSVSFNNTGIIQNRLFEQEYFDIERVEVLRGPQGTLYGRNATSGVINVISAKPDLNDFDGWIKGEVGNYHTKRLSAMINVPLVEDRLAVRLAGAFTDRVGYDFNSITGNPVNGRDLWSARLTLGFEPTETFRGNFIWERFEEDDDRLRTGKQLCHRDDGPLLVGDADPAAGGSVLVPGHVRRALFGQGCKAGSLYTDAAFGTPNGLSYNFVLGLLALRNAFTAIGTDENGEDQTVIGDSDPYGGMMQSRNLREIASVRDPSYRAKADLFELNLDWDLTDALTLSSQTAYVDDEVYSFQDYNRFNTVPVFTDTSALSPHHIGGDWSELAPGGVFCDPQIGCTDRVAGFDISQARATQFSQEFRLQSNFDGPVNFSLGANYTDFDVLVDYYIMFNVITAMAMIGPFNFVAEDSLNGRCFASSWVYDILAPVQAVPLDHPESVCPYIDPQPLNVGQNFQGDGHNYYRSKNPYRLESKAAFGELYWDLNETLKLTAGLRYTDDEKVFTPVPTQVLLAPSIIGGGTVARGYPEDPPIELSWGEWTGRLVLDWKPVLPFTDETMVYGSYSHGYKGGGVNPPKPGFADENDLQSFVDMGVLTPAELAFVEGFPGMLPVLKLTAVEYSDTFEPEFVDAFEVGAKNTLLGGALQFNATAFYYDYKDYQVSQIRDRTAVNENFDATVWGVEFETTFAPTRNLRIIANMGYLDSAIADGETSIDIMDRTQGNPNYQLAKPWSQLPSNCVVPTHVAEWWIENKANLTDSWELCGGVGGLLGVLGGQDGPSYDTVLEDDYDPDNYPELNGGAGLLADLGGNELPNAPHWTANVGAQYGVDMFDGWRATVRGDLYWQSQSYHRVYNSEPYDKLRGWWNGNLSMWVERAEDDLKIELYVKNIFDDTPITDAFLNSDDTGLTTNVFVLDPRLIGLSIRKGF
ncbi:MAG TPA: TonB-dependent receptor [Caulobacteraceae bacterium]|nr:TonB-dependent receptor [Caulobacteraceae bacterium]